ncbi:hypothetical protein SAY87_012655 [Trapa incisa]|uniref:GOLD domain-containing protein n=1 Tax=Trapa incisa TaxID=236973 RepID=A0AAN7GT69_9MYRT|nr:hypothetical protein SAY87_012655 [Trapa incisa]
MSPVWDTLSLLRESLSELFIPKVLMQSSLLVPVFACGFMMFSSMQARRVFRSHKVEYDCDTVHASFVVIKSDSAWHYSEDGVDLVVRGPNGEQIQNFQDKISEKFEFLAHRKGVHHFCFTSRSPYHETIDFDVYVGHFTCFDEHAKDGKPSPFDNTCLCNKLEDALFNIQFEQHWLKAQTERQSISITLFLFDILLLKALIESLALVGISVLQVYLLHLLFEKKLEISRENDCEIWKNNQLTVGALLEPAE